MGMFDSFFGVDKEGKRFELQLKNGDCALYEFETGDEVRSAGYEDGIYVANADGYVVISESKVVAVLDHNAVKDKWGNQISIYDIKEIPHK